MSSIRTIKTVFAGDAKGLLEAGAQGTKAIKGWQDGIAKASTAVLSATAGIAVGLGKLGSDFDSAYDTIRTTTGKTGAAFTGLQKDFKAAVVDLPASFGDVSKALAELNQRTGLTGTSLVDLTKQIVQLGKLTGIDTSTLISSTTRVFGDWNIATKDQTKALDELWRASQATGIGIDTLAGTVVQFGAPLRQLGFSFEESISMLAKWEKEGVNTDLVLGGLKKALGAAAKAGEDPVKALDKLTTSIKNAGSTAKANAIAVAALGVKAGPDFAAAVREGRLDFQSLMDTVTNGSDTIAKATTDTADFSEMLQELRNRAFVALEPAATAVFQMLNNGADSLKTFGDWAQVHTETVKKLALGLGIMGATIVALNVGTKVWIAMQAAAAIAANVWKAANWALATSFLGIPIFWIIVAIVALVAGIIIAYKKFAWFRTIVDATGRAIKAAALWFWEKGVKPGFARLLVGIKAVGVAAVWLWQALVTAFNAIVAAAKFVADIAVVVWQALVTAFNAIMVAVHAVADAFTWLWATILQPVFNFIMSGVLSLMNFFKSLAALIFWIDMQAFKPVFNGLVFLFQLVASVVTWWWQTQMQPALQAVGAVAMWLWQNAILPAWNGIVAAFQMVAAVVAWWWQTQVAPALSAVGALFSWIWGMASDNFGRIMGVVHQVGDVFKFVFGAIGGFIASAFSDAVGTAKAAINGLITLLNRAVEAINSNVIDNLNKVPGVSFGHIPSLPHLALGGTAMAGREYLVGEKGPEILRMGAQSGHVTSNASAFGPMTLEIPIQIGDEVVRVVRATIDLSDRSKRRKILAGAGTR